MLLPSAFPFDTLHQNHRPTSTPTPPPSSPGGFLSLSSCRALQAILGSRPASPFPLTISTGSQPKKKKQTSPALRERSQRAPLQPLTQNVRISQRQQTRAQVIAPAEEPRRTNKRSRADIESIDETTSGNCRKADSDYSCYLPCASLTSTNTINYPVDRDTFSTPKRQRRVPLLMPLGLSAEDFEGLDGPPRGLPKTPQKETHEDVDMPAETNDADEATGKEWSTADDRILVSTVLDKLSLSRRDWNDCARRMGKEGDSLGKRWQVLVGEGDVGLRRGSGGRSRPELRRTWTEGTFT